jgi:hypothetical protein
MEEEAPEDEAPPAKRAVPAKFGSAPRGQPSVKAAFGAAEAAAAQRGAVALQYQVFKLAGAHLPVFVGHTDVGAAVREIRLLVACGLHAQAGFSCQVHQGDFGVNPWLNVRGKGLRHIAQGFLIGHQAHGLAAGRNAKPQIGLPVFVEHGYERDQALLEFGQAGFEFDGFRFVRGQCAKPQRHTGVDAHASDPCLLRANTAASIWCGFRSTLALNSAWLKRSSPPPACCKVKSCAMYLAWWGVRFIRSFCRCKSLKY